MAAANKTALASQNHQSSTVGNTVGSDSTKNEHKNLRTVFFIFSLLSGQFHTFEAQISTSGLMQFLVLGTGFGAVSGAVI